MAAAGAVWRLRWAVHLRRLAGRLLVHEGQCHRRDAREASAALFEVYLPRLPRARERNQLI